MESSVRTRGRADAVERTRPLVISQACTRGANAPHADLQLQKQGIQTG